MRNQTIEEAHSQRTNLQEMTIVPSKSGLRFPSIEDPPASSLYHTSKTALEAPLTMHEPY